MHMRLVRRGIGRTAGITLLLVVASVGVVLAHARLVNSSPAANAHLNAPPDELRLEFSEAVSPRTSRIELVSPDSQRLHLVIRGDSVNGTVLRAGVPPLSLPGAYRVEWRLVGPDGHAVTGRYAFTVDSIPAPADTIRSMAAPGDTAAHEPSPDSMSQRLIRFGSMWSMVLVIGASAMALFVLPAATRSGGDAATAFRARTENSMRSLATAGAASLLVLAILRLIDHGVVLSGSLASLRLADLTDIITTTTFGHGWMLQVVVALVLLVRLRSMTTRWNALAGVVVALALSAPFLGHPAAVADLRFLAMPLDAAHLLAAGAWTGSILMLALAAMPNVVAVPVGARIEIARNMLRAFSPLALWSAAIVALTGTLGGWLHLRALDLVVGSEYGMMLIRKVVLVLIIAGLGAYHWRVVQPGMSSERSVARLRGSLALDVAVVLLTLFTTALLAGTPPPLR
jgi:copper transport protein